ncbi:MAG: patatin-like phospholipase family protein [Bdellovibrionaceae bacterium]|nr:patatin-like phospholipase family protein [Pseudobdellovibrionaceae bacterium]
MNIQNKKKIALVLSGGGIKAAAYHIGVCLALKEKGFVFSGGSKEWVQQKFPNPTKGNAESNKPTIRLYVGSSAGAFVASVLASGKSIESLITAFQVGFGSSPSYDLPKEDRIKQLGYRHIFNLNSKRILSWMPETLLQKSILTGGFEVFLKKGFKLNGIFNTNGLERYLRKYVLDENDFSRLGVELYVIATQLNHSRKTIFGPYLESYKNETTKHIGYTKISEAVAASTSLPPMFAPYPVQKPDGKIIYHYDGEIRDTLSTHVAADHGADLIIASYSMQPYHFNAEVGSLHTFGMPAIINQALYQVLEQKVARHIQFQNQKKDTYEALKKACNELNLSKENSQKILGLVKEKLAHNPEVDYIYISPRPQNYEMFFADHFSLNPQILEKILRIGFKSGLQVLREHI